MVAHNTVAAHTHVEAFDAFGEDLLEGEEITFLFEYTQATVSTIECVIDDISFRYPFRSRHKRRL